MAHFLKKAVIAVVLIGGVYYAYTKYGAKVPFSNVSIPSVGEIKEGIEGKIEDFQNMDKPSYSLDIDDAYSDQYEIHTGSLEYRELELPSGITAQGIQKLELNEGGCVIRFVPSSDGEFHIEATECKKLQYYVEKATLYLNASGSITGGESFANGIKGSIVTLYCPENTFQISINVELGAGGVEFSDISAQNVRLKCGAGKISVGNMDADELTIDLDAGSISVENLTADKMDADVGMGTLAVTAAEMKEGKIVCSMGTVDMTLSGGKDAYNYSLNTAAGSIRLGEEEYKGLSGEQKIENKASRNIRIECSLGSVKLHF